MATSIVAYLLSRSAFVGIHVVYLYWLNFIFNDPFGVGGNTMDAREILPYGECTHFDPGAFVANIGSFLIFSVPHSLLARTAVKKRLGLYNKPYERPLFAFMSPITWFLSIHTWTPFDNCARFDITNISAAQVLVFGGIFLLANLYLLGLLYTLPDHILGTSHYKYCEGEKHAHKLLTNFPYNLVRHPSSASFLWMYWALPAYTGNHLQLAALWTIYIIPATLLFEEGGLRGPTGEFGEAYEEYASKVNAFTPSKYSIATIFGCPMGIKANGKSA
ncbi:conserved hypothetical protein [Perkinsus marinus ATCC 50983]|uniref:Nuclear envelope membrane protein n=1 Tax=Perkinsus marinus (strain ATCC 50983 / TXsc) TaxID=423536 RepID=C5L7P3_PERM5|nr:conserved hypothetical protein [Perkinsus marinus ATCC 50983]EER07505.1 conserved hypothetical protein [Perkinsus marinus ATCC 50983]|eukprot:XP_002775689.1 conserved hypothetical protein [Perkinsus marinus ATCC 50983]